MTNKEDNLKICCICGKHYHGYGNNAEPVRDGKCCDECNYNIVIPARLAEIYNRRNNMQMTPTQKLLKRLPKKYHDRVVSLEAEDDLCDDCKYMLYYSEQYTDGECYGSSYPVRSITEAIDYIKNSLYK